MDRLTAALVGNGVRVELFNLAVTDIGKVAMALVDAGTIVVGVATASDFQAIDKQAATITQKHKDSDLQ